MNLTERQEEVMRLVIRGKTNKEIGRDLYSRERTVKYYITNLIVKLRVRRKAELAYSALHTWDLARATGQDERLDHDALKNAMAFLLPLDEMIRGPELYGPKIISPENADEQTKLLNFAGRAT